MYYRSFGEILEEKRRLKEHGYSIFGELDKTLREEEKKENSGDILFLLLSLSIVNTIIGIIMIGYELLVGIPLSLIGITGVSISLND